MNRRDALKTLSIGMGYTISAASLASLASACRSESKAALSWTPTFFSPAEGSAIEELLDIMLPATNTPGAKDMAVAPLMDIILKDVYNAKDQQKFRDGMAAFFGTNGEEAAFNKIDRKQLTALLEADAQLSKKELEEIAGLLGSKTPPEDATQRQRYYRYSFIKDFRSLAISCFFSSQKIGMEHLNYAPVPGPYQGCIPASDVGNDWAL